MRRYFPLLALLFLPLLSYAHEHKKELEFIENNNQWHENVLYRSAAGGGAVFLERTGISYSFLDPSASDALHDIRFADKASQDAFSINGHAWKMTLVNALDGEVSGQNENDHYFNFFTGNDQAKWASKVSSYGKVTYEEIYEGIDMMVYSHESNFKYDFVVAPQADPENIKMSYDGLDRMKLVDGNLLLETSIGDFTEKRPYAYQIINGLKEEVACKFVLNENTVHFAFPDGYETDKELIIDPELIAATLSGTTGFESNFGHCAAFDIEGNIYTGCVAGGNEYPVTAGSFSQTYGGGTWDIGISKLTPDGTDLLWATFLGGVNADYPHSLIVNSGQEIYVYGSTSSDNYPVTPTAFQNTFGGDADIIVSHLEADGSALIGSTYVGGTQSDGQNAGFVNGYDTYRGEIYLDFDNDPVIVSSSSSSNFPTLANAYQPNIAGGQDAVLFKMNPSLSSMSVSTFIGGPELDSGYGVRTSVDGSFYICGAASEGFQTSPGSYQPDFIPGGGFDDGVDGFVAKLDAQGSNLLVSTYFGTEDDDQAYFIDLDLEEDVWIYGQGGDLPITDGVYSDDNGRLFISKLSPDLDELLVSSRIGQSDFGNVPDAFLVDNCDNIYITCYNAGDFETTDDALFESSEGGFYLATYEADMTDIIFGTYYTGNHVDGGTSRFDKNGIVYQGVCSGGGFSTTPDAWATDQSTGWDIGVFKINFDASGVNAAVAANDISGCAPFEITFENFSIGDQFLWDFGDGVTSTEYAPTYIYEDPGVYEVSLIASDSLSCNLADTIAFEISISTPQDYTPSFTFDVDCETQSINCVNTSGFDFLDYFWDMGDGTVIESYDAEYQYDMPGDYTISLLAVDNGCDTDEEITENITVLPSVQAFIDSENIEACEEIEVTFINTSLNADNYSWDFGDGTNSTDEEPTHTFTGPATFEVVLSAFNVNTCNEQSTDTLLVTIGANQVLQPDFSIIQTDCEDFIVESNNTSVGENSSYSWNMGDGTILTGENVTHSYDAEGNYTVTLTMTDTLCDITETISEPILITSEVVAVIGNGDIVGCSPFTVEFENASIGEATWDFGDGSATVSGNPVLHTFDQEGTYTVTLSVVGTGACSGEDEVTSEVVVQAPPTLIPNFEATPVGECEDMSFQFTDMSAGDTYSVSWDLGDGTETNELTPIHSYSSPGSYIITLIVTDDICDVSAEAFLAIDVDPMDDYTAGPDVPLCHDAEFVTLDAGIEAAEYQWSTSDTEQVIEVTESGTYEIQVNMNGCWFRDEINVFDVIELEFYESVIQCQTESNTIVIPYEEAIAYLWDDGTSEPFRDIEESGTYEFTVTDVYGCEHKGQIDAEITPNEAPVFIPNAFSPNNDGINDLFRPEATNLEEYEMSIFNRWGDRVFFSTDPEQSWRGNGESEENYYVPDGVYTYVIKYRSLCSTDRIQKEGIVTVVR